jgi:hypothetical protein
MNETGDPDYLLSLVLFDRNHWLAWVAGEGDQFRVLPDNLAHRILLSAARLSSPNARSQSGRIQPTLHARGHGRYLFVRPNTFAACLWPQAEVQVSGQLVHVQGATTAQLHRRLVGAWRQGAFG